MLPFSLRLTATILPLYTAFVSCRRPKSATAAFFQKNSHFIQDTYKFSGFYEGFLFIHLII